MLKVSKTYPVWRVVEHDQRHEICVLVFIVPGAVGSDRVIPGLFAELPAFVLAEGP